MYLFKFIDEKLTRQGVAQYAHVPTRKLAGEAAKVRAEAQAKFAAWLASLDREQPAK